MSGMSDQPIALTPAPTGYADWLAELNARIPRPQTVIPPLRTVTTRLTTSHVITISHDMTTPRVIAGLTRNLSGPQT